MKRDLKDLKNTTTAKDADTGYVPFAEGVHGIVSESEVNIKLMLAPLTHENPFETEQDRALIRVEVFSKMKTGLFSFTDIRIKGKSQSEMERAIDMAVGVLCERQAVFYGDCHDSKYFCRKGVEHYKSLCAELSRKR